MSKLVKASIGGMERQLLYSVSVMFDMAEKYGDIKKAMKIIQADNRESLEAVRWFAVQMANEAELHRRNEGYDPLPMVEEKDVPATMTPYEYAELRAAVVDAIARGYKREVEDNKETDLGLAELREKKATARASKRSTTTSP